MAALVLISNVESIPLVLPWASFLTQARDSTLTVVCWTYSALPSSEMEDAGPASEDLVRAVRTFYRERGVENPPEVIGIDGPSEAKSIISLTRSKETRLIIAASCDPTGNKGASYATNPLLKQSPCTTVILFGIATRAAEPERVFVAASDNTNDEASLILANQLSSHFKARLCLGTAEFEAGLAGQEIGRRELDDLMRNSGVEKTDDVDYKVLEPENYEQAAEVLNQQDLVFFGANFQHLPQLLELSERPTIAVVKRAPPLRGKGGIARESIWNTRLNPADYADLVQGLRRGSRLGSDFLCMLGLAAVVASLGLLQNSAAVVIGSMLLAPLMTPMIGCGLALAQANPKLGKMALKTVAVGLLCTLVISFIIGLITPGIELTPQIYARGAPTMLDLLVAVASAAAASYALARPNLVGSIAGVAIATALVPPLCSVGISLAYHSFNNAEGAALLFVTNFLAIVLASAVTFSVIGITSSRASTRQKLWVFRVAAIFATGVIFVCVPLQHAMNKSLVEGKPQPRAYPLSKTIMDGLEERLANHPETRLISAGQPSSHFAKSDVVLILGTTGQPDPQFMGELIDLIRTKMEDESVVVEVHCVEEVWRTIAE